MSTFLAVLSSHLVLLSVGAMAILHLGSHGAACEAVASWPNGWG